MTSNTDSSERTRLQRLDEASQWLLRMQDPKRSEEELAEWLRWIEADHENFPEFERLQRDWKDLEVLRSASAETRWRPTRLIWALAAGVAALALVFGTIHYQRGTAEIPARRQVTAAVTSRAATLPDGSRMILGVQSLVNMDFNGLRRQLDLSNGEAYFKVKYDKSRPFVVHAGEVSVTAVGTSFDVRRSDKVTITVEEGTVEVRAVPLVKDGRKGQAAVWRVEAGYQLTYSPRLRTATIASVNPIAELAWRNGELAYVRETLGAVVENLNRYSTRKIIIEDPAIARLLFTGTAFAASLDDWLAGVEQVYPISVKHTDGNDIILSSRR